MRTDILEGEVKITAGKLEDICEVEAMYNDLNEHLACTINYPGWKKDVYPTRKEAEAGIATNHLYVARIDNVIVGSIILNHLPEAAYSNVKWNCEDDYSKIFVVHTLVVHPQYLKYGIGKKLIEFAQEYGKSLGMIAIRLDVYEKNIPAISLYERYGFHYIETVDLGLSEYGLDWFRLYEKQLK